MPSITEYRVGDAGSVEMVEEEPHSIARAVNDGVNVEDEVKEGAAVFVLDKVELSVGLQVREEEIEEDRVKVEVMVKVLLRVAVSVFVVVGLDVAVSVAILLPVLEGVSEAVLEEELVDVKDLDDEEDLVGLKETVGEGVNVHESV